MPKVIRLDDDVWAEAERIAGRYQELATGSNVPHLSNMMEITSASVIRLAVRHGLRSVAQDVFEGAEDVVVAPTTAFAMTESSS